MTGTPDFLMALLTLYMAESWGTPTPAIIRVVQIDPGPIPTLTASAPASTKSDAASAVAILPATKSMSGYLFLAFLSISKTYME